MSKEAMVQVYNPKIKRWVKIDTKTGRIIAHKKTLGSYKNILKYGELKEDG